jgi:hypothetical protein
LARHALARGLSCRLRIRRYSLINRKGRVMEQHGTELATADKVSVQQCHSMAFRIDRDQLSVFFPMLQRGVTVQAEVGCSLKNLLCSQFSIPEEYVNGRITTIFLDNSPVDDMERSLIHEGSRVSLSAAMPGLVGATMRRSSFYAALRHGITHLEKNDDLSIGQGTVKLKLFNLLLPELAPLILARGVLLSQDELDDLVSELKSGSHGIASSYFCRREDCGGVLITVSIKD